MKKYDIAAYIWPAYTGSELRTRIFWPDGIGEWQTVKSATAKFEGHAWPRKPLWGYLDEADPSVMEMQIDEASKYGVNVFIYDWYWYDDRPFLEQCLNNGYLKARNNDKVKFFLMWANHTASSCWDKRTAEDNTPIWNGEVDFTRFKHVVERVINKYFSHPSYYKIDGKPVFMIYELDMLINGLGGIEETKKALDYFRNEVVKAGFPGLYLQITLRRQDAMRLSQNIPDSETAKRAVKSLEIDGGTYYQHCHAVDVDRPFPEVFADFSSLWEDVSKNYDMDFYPHVSMGWDNNPRFNSFRKGITTHTTPENIKKAFIKAKEYIDAHPSLPAPLITVNSWNEWTESSYLQPDDINGYGYLEALKSVFLDEE